MSQVETHGAAPQRRHGALPLHAFLVPFPIVCFVGALITDLFYIQTERFIWTTFSIWLLTFGLIITAFAVIAGLVDFIRNRGDVRSTSAAWVHGAGNGIASILAIINAFVHSRDGWTTVMPDGLILSILTVAIMVVTVPLGKIIARRQAIAIAEGNAR